MLGLLAVATALAALGPVLATAQSAGACSPRSSPSLAILAVRAGGSAAALGPPRSRIVGDAPTAIDQGLSGAPARADPLQRHQRVGADGDRCSAADCCCSARALILASAPAAARRDPAGGSRDAADRARDRAVDDRPPAGAPTCTGCPALRLLVAVRVGRADRRSDDGAGRRRARGARGRGGDDRSRRRWTAHAVVQLRVAGRRPEPGPRRVVRLVPALRAAQLAAQRPRDARRRRPRTPTTGRPRTSTCSTAAAGWRARRTGGRPAGRRRRRARSSRWTQTIQVTLRAIKTDQRDRRRVRGQPPSISSAAVEPGVQPGHVDRRSPAAARATATRSASITPHPDARPARRPPATPTRAALEPATGR